MKVKQTIWFLGGVFIGLASTVYADTQGSKCLDLYQKESYTLASKTCLPLAEKGDKDAQMVMGVMYGNGQGVEQNSRQMLEWLTKSANQGQFDAAYNLGNVYFSGIGIDVNYTMALKWYKLSLPGSKLGYAENRIGASYLNGLGVAQDYEQAKKYFLDGAAKNNEAAMYNLGLMYERGTGVSQDYRQAFNWYQKAAERNSGLAMNQLYLMYANGKGVSKDEKKALQYLINSVQLGCSVAMINLAGNYANGLLGLPQDKNIAIMYMQKALLNDDNSLNSEAIAQAKQSLKNWGSN